MDKEVELILTKLRIVSKEEERGMYLCDKEHSKLLLDYITNLQEKYERMKENAKILSNGYNDLEKRNEKAIEYIKGWQSFPHTNGSTHNELRNLLNILQGEDKDE